MSWSTAPASISQIIPTHPSVVAHFSPNEIGTRLSPGSFLYSSLRYSFQPKLWHIVSSSFHSLLSPGQYRLLNNPDIAEVRDEVVTVSYVIFSGTRATPDRAISTIVSSITLRDLEIRGLPHYQGLIWIVCESKDGPNQQKGQVLSVRQENLKRFESRV